MRRGREQQFSLLHQALTLLGIVAWPLSLFLTSPVPFAGNTPSWFPRPNCLKIGLLVTNNDVSVLVGLNFRNGNHISTLWLHLSYIMVSSQNGNY